MTGSFFLSSVLCVRRRDRGGSGYENDGKPDDGDFMKGMTLVRVSDRNGLEAEVWIFMKNERPSAPSGP